MFFWGVCFTNKKTEERKSLYCFRKKNSCNLKRRSASFFLKFPITLGGFIFTYTWSHWHILPKKLPNKIQFYQIWDSGVLHCVCSEWVIQSLSTVSVCVSLSFLPSETLDTTVLKIHDLSKTKLCELNRYYCTFSPHRLCTEVCFRSLS